MGFNSGFKGLNTIPVLEKKNTGLQMKLHTTCK